MAWKNRIRVLVLCSRGCSHRDRHLMMDFKTLMPQTKGDSKIDKKAKLIDINEICEMRNCNKCLYFESRKKKDLYMWLSNVPHGPSVKFLAHNVHTMEELKLTGNCLKGSRPVLCFDDVFDKVAHLSILKELFIQVFGTPNHHPQSQPFIDHIFSFSLEENRIWFRNYQIVNESGKMEEVGPRVVFEPIRIFAGSFCGAVLYENPEYVSPNTERRQMRLAARDKYINRVSSKKALVSRLEKHRDSNYVVDVTDAVFDTRPNDNHKEDVSDARHSSVRRLKHDIEKKRKWRRNRSGGVKKQRLDN